MIKRYYNPYNETIIIAMVILISNIYIFFNHNLTLGIGKFLCYIIDFLQYNSFIK